MSAAPPGQPSAVRPLAARLGRVVWRTLLVALGLIALTLSVLFARPLYHHLVSFPRDTAALERLRAEARPVARAIDQTAGQFGVGEFCRRDPGNAWGGCRFG